MNALTSDRVKKLEDAMLKKEQVSCPVTHSFGPGTYIREVKIPAGTLAVGHHQNFEHMNIFVKGRVTMFNDDGTIVELKAPMIFTGKPGRKIGYIHEDMTWLNVYPTDEKDIEKIEAKFLTKSEVFMNSLEARNKLKLLQSNVDVKDYEKAIAELGFTEELVRKQSENTDDLTDLPPGNYKIKVGKSFIEGQGLFATGDILPGEIICPARISGKRTIAGRYTNHSATQNAMFIKGEKSEIDLVATQFISGCKGGFDGEEITVDYREAYKLNLQLAKGVSQCQV